MTWEQILAEALLMFGACVLLFFVSCVIAIAIGELLFRQSDS